MDHVVDHHARLNVLSVVGAKRSKSCKNTSLSKAFASPRKIKSRTSSNESEYEVVAELSNEDSENEACSSESEDIPDKNDNNELTGPDDSNNKHFQVNDPSETVEMDEVFVIVDDDANDVLEENIETREASDGKKQCLSDGDDFEMDEIIAEFAEQEKKKVPQLSDNEDEMDSILDEFAETQSNDFKDGKVSDTKVILSSEGEDEMECLLEEFSKENISDEDSSTIMKKLPQNNNTPLINQTEQNADNETNTCDIRKDTMFDTSNQLKNSSNSEIQSHGVQQSCSFRNNNIDCSSNKSSIPIKSECVIVCDTDEKSNNSNCSSVEILLDDVSVKGTDQNISLKEKDKTSNEMLNCVANDSPCFSLSDGEKYDFDNMILDIVDEDNDDVISHPEVTNNICSGNISHAIVNTPVSVTQSSDKSSISSLRDSADNIMRINSEAVTNNEIKKFVCSKESISVNKTSNEILPSSVNELNSIVENHSNVVSKTVKDQIIPENFVESSSIVSEGGASSQMNKTFASERKTVEVSDTIVEGVVSSDDRKKDNKMVHDDQNKLLEEERKDKCILNDVSAKNETEFSKAGNDISDMHAVQLETSLEPEIAVQPQRDEIKQEERVKPESESVEEKKIKLDIEENSSTPDSQIENKALSNITVPNASEDVNFATNSVVLSNISSELLPVVDDTNKRKLDDGSDTDVKRLKKDNEENGDSNYLNNDESSGSSTSGDFGLKNTDIEDLVHDVTVADYKAVDKINSLIPWNPAEKIETTNTVLDRIAMYVCQEVVKESFKKKYLEEKNKVKELENKIENLSTNLESFRLQFADFRETQKVTFAEQNFKAKLHTRTVGVNVKIYRESEIKQALSMQNALKNKPAVPVENANVKNEKHPLVVPKTEALPVTSNIKTVKSGSTQLVLPNPQLKDTVITPVLSPQQANVRKQLLPRIIAHTNRPMGAQVISGLQQRMAPPNVTVSGNRIIPLMSSASRTPSTHSVVLVPSSTITSSSRNNLIDLTKEEHARNVTNGTSIPTTTVAKVTVPGMPNNPNVLVPLREYLQLLPPGTKGPPVIQPAPTSRPAIIPQIPSNLIGARTVTYLLPQNAGIGGRGIPQFLPQTNQQVQFLLRVTNPGSAPALSPVVNSISRPALPQNPVTTTTRASSGLILFSHTSKHPAPFPKSPHYPDTRGKALPPKPSLKGSKNSNGGIVLSWNMCLTTQHANISSYQLFAYQETDGPVDASLWKKVGDVNALPLPMACTLTQFVDKNRYYFTVRAVDVYQRFGPFSDPVSILYDKEGDSSTKK